MATAKAEERRAAVGNIALMRRFWEYARADRRWLMGGLVAVPLASAAALAQPWLLKEAIDGPIRAAASGTKPAQALATIALLFLAAVVGEYLSRGFQLYALQLLGYRALERLRRAVFEGVVGQGQSFFDRRSTGSLLSRSTNDVEAIGEVLAFGMVGVVGDVFDILMILVAMFLLGPKLTLSSLLVAPLIWLLVDRFRAGLRHWSGEIRVANAAAAGFFSEALAGRAVVQALGRERLTLDEFKALNHRTLRAHHRGNWYDASLYAVMDGVAGLSVAALIQFGAGDVLEGTLSLGLLVAFIQYIQRLFVPVRELSGKVATIERAMASLERIFALLDVDERVPSGAFAPATVRGALTLHRLRFAYRDGERPVLNDISLEIAPGSVVALVGPTGSGKSTIAKLLARLYAAPPDAVLLDGVPLEHWSHGSLRAAIGVVAQDVVVFSGTLRDNVALGRSDVDDVAVLHALERAQLGSLTQRLGGLDGEIREHGANLSAGERQLLSIARVLALDPPVVVLDEATASIDPVTEQAVNAAIDQMVRGRTVLIIAHRLATIRRATEIVVLVGGEVVERGRHGELVARGGVYARLVAQAAGHAGGEVPTGLAEELVSTGGAAACAPC